MKKTSFLEASLEMAVKNERERILNMLEEQARQCEKAGLWADGLDMRAQLQELHLGINAAIAIIKGDN